MDDAPAPVPVRVPDGLPRPAGLQQHLVRHALHLLALLVLGTAVTYGALSYEFVPSAWRFVERRHPALDAVGTRAFTASGIPADPLNLAFVGTVPQLQSLMREAGWTAADPITLKSSTRIAYDSVARRRYDEAPVSDLFVRGKRQDLAFEKPSGGNPAQRHHVRFWQAEERDALGRPLWIGAATYDTRVGLSHTTGQITHHISANVDRERDELLHDLPVSGAYSVKWIDDFQPGHTGRNGGGDPFFTDARLAVVTVLPSP